jgi:site-specific DNA-methyltransferase (adenine-specific)
VKEYIKDNMKLYNGDCMEGMAEYKDNYFDLVIVDPPYNLDRFKIWNKKQTVDNFATAEYAWVSMGLKKPAKIFEYSIHQHNADKGKIHPTQKPVKLYSWLLQNYSSQEHKILDTHLGSASHAIAWHYFQKGGEFVGFELDEEYFDKSIKRIKQETAQLSMF